MKSLLSLSALAAGLGIAAPCQATAGEPIPFGDGLTFDPIIDGRLRWEHVEQDNIQKDADAVTLRMRAGFEVQHDSGLAFLAEAEGNLAISNRYNDTIPGNNGYLGAEPYPVVADPETVELNRLQVAYKGKDLGLTVGRQRIVYDNARFVGDVIWRQNEQTFDAVRGTAKLGPVVIDATYAISQRTVFGIDSPNEHFDGDLVLAQAGIDTHGVKLKGFTYLLDYDDRVAYSSKTFGVLASTSIPLGGKTKIEVNATYARQSDYKANPVDYSAGYIWGELGASVAGFGIKGGYEELGSDDGVAAFQTPLATLHAFKRLGRPVPDDARRGPARLLRIGRQGARRRRSAEGAEGRGRLSQVRERRGRSRLRNRVGCPSRFQDPELWHPAQVRELRRQGFRRRYREVLAPGRILFLSAIIDPFQETSRRLSCPISLRRISS